MRTNILREFVGSNNRIYIFVFAAGLLFSVFLHYKLGMDGNFDTANYHAYIGWSALKGVGYQQGSVAQYHTYLNPVADVLNYSAFTASPLVGAALHSLLFASTMLALFKLVKLFIWNNYYSFFAVAIGMTSAMTVSTFGTWMNEHVVALPVIIGLYLLLKHINDRALYLCSISGFLFGVALGLKLTAAQYVAGAIAVVFIFSKSRFKESLGLLIGCLIGYVLVDGYFMFMRWDSFQNPIFPFANNIFKSLYYPVEWKSFGSFKPEEILKYLALPATWVHSGDLSEINTVRDGRLLLAYVGIALILFAYLFKRSVKRDEFGLVVFFVASWVAWILVFRVYRYLVVLELLSGLIFIIALSKFFYGRSDVLRLAILHLAFILVLVVTVYPDWGRRQWSSRFHTSNLAEIVIENKADFVFFADNRLSYLSPMLEKAGVKFAYLFSQQWWDGNRGVIPIDPGTSHVELNKNIFFLQYSTVDPRGSSVFLSKAYQKSLFHCISVSTNMPWSPYLCSFKNSDEFPLIKRGVEYKHNSPQIMFSDGWSFPEQSHRWSNDKKASIVMRPEVSSCAQTLEIGGTALGEQFIQVDIDGVKIHEEMLAGDFLLELNGNFFQKKRDGVLKLNFNFPNAYAPSQSDSRVLAVALRSLRLDCEGGYRLFNVSNSEWLKGVAKEWGAAFFVKNTNRARNDFAVGNRVRFVDGSVRKITSYRINNDDLIVYLDGGRLNGNLVGYPNSVQPFAHMREQ